MPMDALNPMFPYRFIAIEGNIGAGKTTLSCMLSEQHQAKLILEQFTDNPFLPFFYKNPERFAFPVELFFMTERHKQLQENLTNQDLFHPLIIADYFFIKTLLFAKNNLNDEEFRLFQRLYNVLNATFPKPELLIYLHRPVEILLKNIRKRGRAYESDISGKYLQEIQEGYFEYFKNEEAVPILILDIGETDFLTQPEAYERLQTLMTKNYSKGVNMISF